MGSCGVGGTYHTGSVTAAFAVTETNDVWGTASELPGVRFSDNSASDLESVSCTAAGYCSAGGYYQNGPSYAITPFVVSEATVSATKLALTAANVTYGDEQAEHLSATVTSPAGIAPTGTVSVTAGTTVVCTMTLTAGTGTCTPSATRLPAGTYHLTAAYGGDSSYLPSGSGSLTMTVAKASAKVGLTLSRTAITYGLETAERLTVAVTPQYAGTPTGKVTIKTGTTTICVITLNTAARGSCTLTARQLKAGSYTLAASYGGNTDFRAATSPGKALKVAK